MLALPVSYAMVNTVESFFAEASHLSCGASERGYRAKQSLDVTLR